MKHNASKTLFALFAAIALAAGTSCNRPSDNANTDMTATTTTTTDNNSMMDNTVRADSNSNKDPHAMADDHNDAKFKGDAEKDADFLVDAAVINLKEIAASQVAAKRAKNSEVHDLAHHMITDHTKAMAELKALAASKNITIPASLGEDDTKKARDLADKKPSDFDYDYADLMVDDHKKAVDKFDHASKSCQDGDIKAWAAIMVPALQKHLDMAMAVKDHVKK